MKKLNKLQFNSEKLMKNEELITLKGGYGGSLTCKRDIWYGGDCTTQGALCVDFLIRGWCNDNCMGWDSAICVG